MKRYKEDSLIYVERVFYTNSIMTITLGLELSKIRTLRASVIPYLVRNGQVFFLLAIDRKSKQITDFGGGVKKYESSLIGALREFKEESREIFGELYQHSNNKTLDIALKKGSMSTLFIPLNCDWYDNAGYFFDRSKKKKGVFDEVSTIIWVSSTDFVNLYRNNVPRKTMWKRLQRFYSSTYTESIVPLLKERYNCIFPQEHEYVAMS